MKTYDIEVTREGRWWMVSIPELDGLTQARRLGESRQMAAEWIATMTDAALEDITVDVRAVIIDGHDIMEQARRIRELRESIDSMTARLSEITRSTARELVEHEVPVRDVGEVLDVSPQRVSQLVNG